VRRTADRAEEVTMARWPRRGGAAPSSRVHKITAARPSLTEDIRSRQTRYLISMTIRTACFLLAIITDGWLRWMFFVAALVLPYIAVVLANAGREMAEEVPLVAPPPQPQIGPGRPSQ
jgi:Protein of unknown function (DUF3099)